MTVGLHATPANAFLDAHAAAYPWIKFHVGDPGAAGTANAAVETDRVQAAWDAAANAAIATSAELRLDGVAGTEDFTHWSGWSAGPRSPCRTNPPCRPSTPTTRTSGTNRTEGMEMNVRLNGNRTVHIAAMQEDRITGRSCDPFPGGGWKRIRAEITTDAVTCKSCLRIQAAH